MTRSTALSVAVAMCAPALSGAAPRERAADDPHRHAPQQHATHAGARTSRVATGLPAGRHPGADLDGRVDPGTRTNNLNEGRPWVRAGRLAGAAIDTVAR